MWGSSQSSRGQAWGPLESQATGTAAPILGQRLLLSGLFVLRNVQATLTTLKAPYSGQSLMLSPPSLSRLAPSQALLRLFAVSYSQVLEKAGCLTLLAISPSSWDNWIFLGVPFVYTASESAIPHPNYRSIWLLPLLVLSSLRTGFSLSLSMLSTALDIHVGMSSAHLVILID